MKTEPADDDGGASSNPPPSHPKKRKATQPTDATAPKKPRVTKDPVKNYQIEDTSENFAKYLDVDVDEIGEVDAKEHKNFKNWAKRVANWYNGHWRGNGNISPTLLDTLCMIIRTTYPDLPKARIHIGRDEEPAIIILAWSKTKTQDANIKSCRDRINRLRYDAFRALENAPIIASGTVGYKKSAKQAIQTYFNELLRINLYKNGVDSTTYTGDDDIFSFNQKKDKYLKNVLQGEELEAGRVWPLDNDLWDDEDQERPFLSAYHPPARKGKKGKKEDDPASEDVSPPDEDETEHIKQENDELDDDFDSPTGASQGISPNGQPTASAGTAANISALTNSFEPQAAPAAARTAATAQESTDTVKSKAALHSLSPASGSKVANKPKAVPAAAHPAAEKEVNKPKAAPIAPDTSTSLETTSTAREHTAAQSGAQGKGAMLTVSSSTVDSSTKKDIVPTNTSPNGSIGQGSSGTEQMASRMTGILEQKAAAPTGAHQQAMTTLPQEPSNMQAVLSVPAAAGFVQSSKNDQGDSAPQGSGSKGKNMSQGFGDAGNYGQDALGDTEKTTKSRAAASGAGIEEMGDKLADEDIEMTDGADAPLAPTGTDVRDYPKANDVEGAGAGAAS
ncbi:uncharacterized protein LTR77_009099 [Saxophila tyrrhenica]|uniref:Uncharacterized protein n=1 Tax=Saxophila tyrrhenica TaxID=1690608 RepID=A0AAV9P0H1_9PEZI|nr:hypothetical protein LTR77_009099 [Saxophila tyrrhenica]